MRVRPIPENAVEPIGIMIYVQGVLTDADSAPTLVVTNTDNGVVLISGSSVYESTGKYQYMLQSTQTAVQGNYSANWTYTISGNTRLYNDSFVITDQMPYWQNLTYDERQMVTGIVHRLDKSFDSTAGGPYLQELRQSGFNIYEEVAMVMTGETMDYMNYEFQPVFSPAYEVGFNAMAPFPSTYWGVLATQTYAHFLKHIARNYIEQPTPQGMSAAWMDRRDYYNRWWQLYTFEKEIADKQLRQMKRAFMVGSKRSLLVAGGLIPRMFINPARPHFMYAAVNAGGI
jgi:hypothetical protein